MMIETQVDAERVLLFGVQTQEVTDDRFQELMREMTALTDTAGGLPVAYVTQKLPQVNKRSLVGSGKLQEIQEQIEDHAIDLAISLNRLTPSTNRLLEDEWGIRVIDRTQLILDIFAQRARSREGKLQVELAQYQYLLPRIIGQGKAMSRLGGGIGTRGPGETKLESDRRHIRSRINQIESDLKQLEAHRDRTRSRRQASHQYNLGLVGYTNAGKSTLLTALTASETYIQDQLFATLDPLTRQLEIHGHDRFTLTDTIGFIEELPTELIHAFRSTLEEMRYMDLLIHVVDASHPARLMHEQTLMTLLEDLDLMAIPRLTVYNKMDQVVGEFVPTLFPNVQVSLLEEDGVDRLKEAIWQACIDQSVPYYETIDQANAHQLAQLRQETLVERLDFDPDQGSYLVKGYRKKYSHEHTPSDEV